MNRKSIIQIVVIVICFGGAAFVIYNGFFKDQNSGGDSVIQSVDNSNQALENPFPFGDDLSGELKKVLSKNRLEHNTFVYPQIKETEIGIFSDEFIKPLPEQELE